MSADLALAADPLVAEQAADPGEFIIQACERAKTWLREALDRGDIDQIAECRSQAEAVRIYTMSRQLGMDAQLSATEIVRRAERGLAQSVRRGQENGEIKKRGDGGWGARSLGGNGGTTKKSPGEFVGRGATRAATYAMADGVSDEDFEGALADAKAEGDLSRANVARKTRQRRARPRRDEQIPAPGDRSSEAADRRLKLIRQWAAQGSSSRQMSAQLGKRDDAIRQLAREHGIEIPADQVIGRTRRLDSNRIARETVHALEGLAMGAELLEPGDLNKAEIPGWAASLTVSLRVLNRMVKIMKEIADER